VTTGVSLSPDVEFALEELRECYRVSATPTGDGGAIVTVYEFVFGERWTPKVADLYFMLGFNYPHVPIYPYYTTPALATADGRPKPAALQIVNWNGGSYTQISLRINGWDPSINTAVVAVAQVEEQFQRIL
jgi:hypothetical protein